MLTPTGWERRGGSLPESGEESLRAARGREPHVGGDPCRETTGEGGTMSEAIVSVIAVLVLGWAVVSGALARHDVTGPLVFAVAGYLLANPDWGVLTVDIETTAVQRIAEITLALVLFSDAARV